MSGIANHPARAQREDRLLSGHMSQASCQQTSSALAVGDWARKGTLRAALDPGRPRDAAALL